MKTNVTLNDFKKAFHGYGRDDNFSQKGLEALYSWLIELEEDMGEETELDVIALCCDYTESNYEEIRQDYSKPESELDNDELKEWLNDNTFVVEVDSSTVIYQSF